MNARATGLFGSAATAIFPGVGPEFVIVAALVGMTSLFGAVVQAPVTGIVLVVEMTAVTSAVLPMILASAVALLIARLLRTAPVYTTLRERMLVSK